VSEKVRFLKHASCHGLFCRWTQKWQGLRYYRAIPASVPGGYLSITGLGVEHLANFCDEAIGNAVCVYLEVTFPNGLFDFFNPGMIYRWGLRQRRLGFLQGGGEWR
jgi:hypothetical protein